MKGSSIIKSTGVASVLVLAVGCAGTPGPVASQDFSNMNCEEIESTLVEFRTATEGLNDGMLAGLVALFSPEAAQTQQQLQMQAREAYQKAKTQAEPIMRAKGCDTGSL